MTSFLRKAAWIGVLGLLVIGPPARSQETEKAEQKKKTLWETLQDKSKSMLDGAEGAVEEAGKAALKEAKEKYFPILREAGYEVSEVRLTFSLTPGVSVRAARVSKVSDEEWETLFQKYEDDPYATGILETIFTAERIEAEGLELKAIHVTLGLHPQATLVLRPIDDNAAHRRD